MKYIKLWLVILFLGLLGTASAQITFFEGTFEDAMAKAKKEKKNLFVDFYADWCEPVTSFGNTYYGFHLKLIFTLGDIVDKLLDDAQAFQAENSQPVSSSMTSEVSLP